MSSPPAGRLRVLVFTTELGSGGAEMQALRIANHLDRDQFEVELAILSRGGSYEKNLRSDVRLHALQGAGRIAKVLALRSLVSERRPDVLCSFLDLPNLFAGLACAGIRNRPHLVACVQAPPSISWHGSLPRRLLLKLLAAYYSRAERIIAISRGVADDVAGFAPRARARTVVVYNAGVDEHVAMGSKQPLEPDDPPIDGPLVVACGRLVAQKGFDDLLDAFAIVRSRIPDAKLWIVGEGPDRRALERRLQALSLQGSAHLLGFRENPFRYMAKADVFVLSSLFEGFGNVIVEAMACGAPVVSTDCPFGPSEIIADGVNGILVPVREPAELAGGILKLLEDDRLRAKIADAGKARSQDFAAERIAGQYGQVFEELAR